MNTTHEIWMVSDVAHLPRDMRRTLRLQFKEFIHTIEDSQLTLKPQDNYRLTSCISVSAGRATAAWADWLSPVKVF